MKKMKHTTRFAIILFQCLPAFGLYIGGEIGGAIAYASAWTMIGVFAVVGAFFWAFIEAYTGAVDDLDDDVYDKLDIIADKIVTCKMSTVPLWQVVLLVLSSVCTAMLQFYLTSGTLLLVGYAAILAINRSVKISNEE